MKNIILFLLMVFSSNLYSNAQTWKNWNTLNSPLSTNQIFDLAIDSDNNKWLTTLDGVVKFDGSNWQTFNTGNSPLPNNQCYSIAVEGRTIWIGSVQGLVKVDSNFNWTIYNRQNSGLPFDNVISIDIDASGNKWLGTLDPLGFDGGGLTKFDNLSWTSFNTVNSPISSDIVSNSFADKSGRIWIATNSGLDVLTNNLWTIYTPINSGLADYSIESTREDKIDSVFWIGTRSGISKFDLRTNSWFTFDTSNAIPSNLIIDVIVDSMNNKWFTSYDKGIVKYDNFSWTVFDSSTAGPFIKYAQKLCLDRNGGIWTNAGYGLVYYGDTLLLNLEKENSNSHSLNNILLYPNPTINELNLINVSFQKLKNISVLNVQGEMVFESDLSDVLVCEKYHFDLPDLAKGIYFVKIQFENNIIVKKIIISNSAAQDF